MRKTNKLLNLLINYRENRYKIMFSIKMKMKIYVIFLLNLWMKRKLNLFYEHEYENNIKLF